MGSWPKIRDTIFVHANSSGWGGSSALFVSRGGRRRCAMPCDDGFDRIPGFLGRSGHGSTAHTIKLVAAKARMPHL